jgi:hypothetical protein
MSITREEIDAHLAQAWEAEHDGRYEEAITLYQQSLQELTAFRDASPKEHFETLNCILFLFSLTFLELHSWFFSTSY